MRKHMYQTRPTLPEIGMRRVLECKETVSNHVYSERDSSEETKKQKKLKIKKI